NKLNIYSAAVRRFGKSEFYFTCFLRKLHEFNLLKLFNSALNLFCFRCFITEAFNKSFCFFYFSLLLFILFNKPGIPFFFKFKISFIITIECIELAEKNFQCFICYFIKKIFIV